MAVTSLTDVASRHAVSVQLADPSQGIVHITEEVTVYNLESEYTEYRELRKTWTKALRRKHPAAQAASVRIHNRMHRFLAHVASQEAVVLVADGLCGDHAAVVVRTSRGVLEMAVMLENWDVINDYLGTIRSQLTRVAPGEWYKGYQVQPDGEHCRWW